jgi:glycine/D-amino acid oxidase-like deaminating enzyme
VLAIDRAGPGTLMVRTGAERFVADDVVLAGGIWGQQVAALAGVHLPLVPVAHPYVHGPLRPPVAHSSPFVRWPAAHVYARDHGDRLGLGTYDHVPVPVPLEQLAQGAELPWPAAFDEAVDRARRLLPEPHRFTVDTRLNGVFAMTADNQPLLGPVEQVPGLWAAQALWVTHAAGAARALARMMTGDEPLVDGLDALLPGRFAGRPDDQLLDESLRLYRDIYATA